MKWLIGIIGALLATVGGWLFATRKGREVGRLEGMNAQADRNQKVASAIAEAINRTDTKTDEATKKKVRKVQNDEPTFEEVQKIMEKYKSK